MQSSPNIRPLRSYVINRVLLFSVAIISVYFFTMLSSGCNIYRFRDVSIPDSIKTVKVNFIENRARYVNPQLSPRLTDRLRQKIVTQTKLIQTNQDNPDWEITGMITEYSVSTSGISQQQVSTNRLNVTVQISLYNHKTNEQGDPITITKNFDFSSNLTLQAAEAQLTDDIVRNLADEIFNRLFSNW